MSFKTKTATISAALCLTAAPAFAFDGGDNPGSGFKPDGVPPQGASDNPGTDHRPSGPEARGIGREQCQEFKANFSESKSEFGKCVAAVAKALRQDTNPRQACEGLSRKPAEDEHRSDFSACVKAAAQALKEQAGGSQS